MSKKHKVLYWLPTIAWMGLIFFLSSRPSLQVSSVGWQDLLFRKTAHILEYFILALFFRRSLTRTTSLTRPVVLLLTLIFSLLYAVSDEFHQTLVPGREGKIFDMAIDASGITFYLALALIL